MKKSLLTICGALAASAFMAQTLSPGWQTLQNTSYTMSSASSKFLDVVSSNVVWGVGYSGAGVTGNFCDFTRTTNGGATFTGGMIYADTNTYVIANLDAVDANTAWVSSYMKVAQAQGAVHKTTNGGATWVNMTAANMFTNAASFTDFVAFVTPSVGIALGDPHAGNANEFEIWRTADAGATWTIVPGANIPNPTSGEFGLVNIYEKYGASNLWFGTNKGRIFRSTDAGQTWNVAVLPGAPTASLNVNDIAFSTPLNGIAAVYNTSVTPSVYEEYVTSNGGVSWTKVTNIDPNLGKNDICGIPGTGVFASCANSLTNTALSYSKDGGITWIDWGSAGIPYLNIDFADATAGWASTFQSAPSTGGIYKYNGPTSIFNIVPNVCLTGSSATVSPVNMSLGNAPTTYSWSSGAGVAFSSATATNPVITFTSNGTYTIALKATNSTTTHTSSQVVNVLTCSAPTASFTVPTGTLCNKVAVNFTNTSSGAPTPTYSWSTSPAANVTISPNSTATNAAITFSTPGTYSVTLWASNSGGTAQVTQTVLISNCAPVSSFSLPAAGCASVAVTPTNTSSGATSYLWSSNPSAFSINTTSAPNPSITFSNPNTYTVSLTATNASGSSVTTHTIVIGLCTSLSEGSWNSNISVFPNPAKDVLNIEVSTSDVYSVSLSNILGKVIFADKSAKDKTTVNLTNVASGVYFLTIDVKGQKTTKKIIVE